MSLAEFFLRLGLVLVAWMVILAHATWLAVLRAVDCDSGSEPWLLTLLVAPVAVAFACLLPSGRKLPGVAKLARLPSVLLIPLWPAAAWTVIETFRSINLRADYPCGVVDTPWLIWWAPVQLVVVAVIAFFAARCWSSANA